MQQSPQGPRERVRKRAPQVVTRLPRVVTRSALKLKVPLRLNALQTKFTFELIEMFASKQVKKYEFWG